MKNSSIVQGNATVYSRKDGDTEGSESEVLPRRRGMDAGGGGGWTSSSANNVWLWAGTSLAEFTKYLTRDVQLSCSTK